MVGRRPKDFRGGDLAEELGIVLLKGIAAVATVPRPEDVGIDAIATLLREGPNRMLVAENSFYVQLKASGERKISYSGDGLRWLRALKLPFFVGIVRLNDAAIDLYGTHRLSQIMLEAVGWEQVDLYFKPVNEGKGTSTKRVTDIAPPLLAWSVHDLANRDFLSHAYSRLKPYIEREQRNIDYRPIGYLENIDWNPGEPTPDYGGGRTIMGSGREEDFLRVLQSMGPHLDSFSLWATSRNDREGLDLYQRLVDHMRVAGFDADPGNIRRAGIRAQMEFRRKV
jgi:hypothetical protein